MGATGAGADYVTPDQLSEAERRLYELARSGTSLAEIAVRLSLPPSEVERRLDVLATRLGLADRTALRDPLPEPVIDMADGDMPSPPDPLSTRVERGGAARRALSRRSLLLRGGAGVGLAAVGAGAAWAFGGGNSGKPGPVVVPGGAGTPDPTSVVAGLDLVEPIDNAYERRTFAPGEPIDWPHGIFFMDVQTGAVNGWRLSPTYARQADPILGLYRLPGPRFIEMLTPDNSTRILVDRETDRAWRYPANQLRLVSAVRPYLVFEELVPQEARPANASGRFYVADYEPAPRSSFHSVAIRFRPDPLVSPDGSRLATVTALGEQFAVQLFDLQSGELMHELALPLATTATVNIRWHREILLSDVFRVELLLANDADFGTRSLRVALPWSGDWPDRIDSGLNAPRSLFFSPDGSMTLAEEALRRVPATGLGGGEVWPVVDVAVPDRNAQRIRCTTLFYGDAIPKRRWTADGRWFFTMIASEATEGPGWERVRYAAWRPGSGVPLLLELPPAPGSEWFHSTDARGPIPHPTDPSLVALGRFEAARFNFSPGFGSSADRLSHRMVANVTATSGPDHLDPWCGNANELVFVIGHGGHDGGWPGAMITPKVEEPPFNDPFAFVVARAGDCLNLRTAPNLGAEVTNCLADGTPLTLWLDARGGPEDGVAFVRNQDGAWVAVQLTDGTTGWVSSAYLDWA